MALRKIKLEFIRMAMKKADGKFHPKEFTKGSMLVIYKKYAEDLLRFYSLD